MFGLFDNEEEKVMNRAVEGNAQVLAQIQNVTASLMNLQSQGEQDSPLSDSEWLTALRKEGRGV